MKKILGVQLPGVTAMLPMRRNFLKALAVMPLVSTVLARAAADSLDPERLAPASTSTAPATSRPDGFDYVFAGAGHNSLVCAAYLAKTGYRVLVLEGRPMIGGGVKTAEILLPGFKQDLCSSSHHVIARNPLLRNNELDLRAFGYEPLDPEVVVHYPFLDGASVTTFLKDVDRTAETIGRFSRRDAETFKRLYSIRAKVLALPPADRVKTREGLYFQRLGALSGFDAARQVWESPYMQAASLSGGRFPGVPGSDPGTGMQAFALMDHVDGRPMPKGGSGMLSVALGRLIEANNGVILTNTPVARLQIEGNKCVGVECVDGSQHRARKAVVSTLHLKQLIDMAPHDSWGEAFVDTVAMVQPEGAMFAFHFALKEPPVYRSEIGDISTATEAAIMQRPESIFQLNEDAARGELNVDDYPLQVVHPSAYDKSRVPPGMSAMKIEGFMPYALKQGPEHWDVIKDKIAGEVLTRYLRHTKNLTRDKVLAKVVMSPLDIERMNPAMWRGGVHHLDRRWGIYAPYRMPIPGLYQTGACTEAGGSVTGQPGRATAIAILQDEGKTLAQAIGKAS